MTGRPDGVRDERRFAPAVREWAAVREERSQTRRDRTELARVLHASAMTKHEIAEVLGVHWARVDRILAGEWGA